MACYRREEVLRRLGSPRHRVICSACRSYVPKLWRTYVRDPGLREVQVCEPCLERVREKSHETIRRQVRDEVQLAVANDEYRRSTARSSSAEYLAACERMRREGW